MRHYLESVSWIERLHRLFLDVVKAELDAIRVRDINNVQSLILYSIAGNEISVGELTQRGYFLGSNVSYNLKRMGEAESKQPYFLYLPFHLIHGPNQVPASCKSNRTLRPFAQLKASLSSRPSSPFR